MAALTAARGRVRDFVRWSRESNEAGLKQGNRDAPLGTALAEAEAAVWFHEQPVRALAVLDRALSEHPLDSLAPFERPYDRLVRVYSLAGKPDRARAYLAAFDERRKQVRHYSDEYTRHGMAGDIALAERRYEDAAREYRAADFGSCPACVLPDLARAYDLAGNADSAIAVFERYASSPSEPTRIRYSDGLNLAGAHKRLGELYEVKGDAQKAASHYSTFIDLWKDADPELQPLVRQARERLATLQRAERR
jgi:tetratricopeptide (TPR) repeat protein